MTKKKKPAARIHPWPNSTFSIEAVWEEDKWDGVKYFWIYLHREAPSRHGRLTAMHAIVPTRKRLDKIDKHFMSPTYRQNMLRAAMRVMFEAGVPDEQAKEFMSTVTKDYPPPSKEELFFEKLNEPFVSLALGKRRNELSYHKTGVLNWTAEDSALLKTCFDDLFRRSKSDPRVLGQLSKMILGGAIGDGFA